MPKCYVLSGRCLYRRLQGFRGMSRCRVVALIGVQHAHTQKHQYDDDGGLHLLIIPRGWRAESCSAHASRHALAMAFSSCLDGLFSAHVGDKGWLHPLPLRGEPRGQP